MMQPASKFEPLMSRPTRYREIEVSGLPRELGRQIGEAARGEVRGFAAVALERVNKTMRVSREKALAVDDIRVVIGDTDAAPYGLGGWASRSTVVATGAMVRAATEDNL